MATNTLVKLTMAMIGVDAMEAILGRSGDINGGLRTLIFDHANRSRATLESRNALTPACSPTDPCGFTVRHPSFHVFLPLTRIHLGSKWFCFVMGA